MRCLTTILFFYPSNQRTIPLETTILAIQGRRIPVDLLTTCEVGPLHRYLMTRGISAYAHPVMTRSAPGYYLRQALYLARFCRQRQVTTVFAHLQHANVIAVCAQYLMSARVVAFRHHFNFVFPGDNIFLTGNRRERILDRFINRLARTIVVPSSGVFNGMRPIERVDISRVIVLPYIYDFEQYPTPNRDVVRSLRSQYPARLTMLMCGRLIPFKRQSVVFPVISTLIREGLDIRLFVLGDGPERAALEEYVHRHSLTDRIIMLGFRDNAIDYMAASDLLVHPSLTEASNNTVKEMGLLGKPAIICRGVGDFDDYLQDGRNAFFVPRATDGSEIEAILRTVYEKPEQLSEMGRLLPNAVVNRFTVTDEAVDQYIALIDS